MSVFIIAEAGVNHNGSLNLAKQLVDEAKKAGANCIKFQTFKSENIVSKTAQKADYQKETTDSKESQLDMLKKLELSYDEFIELKNYCDKKEIEFLSTAFDFSSINFLNDLNMKRWKIPSGELTNLPYLEKIGKLKQEVIISTGMSTVTEIEEAINVLKENGTTNITVLHCTTQYPAPYAEVNLMAIKTLSKLFNLPVGYSDHTKGIEVSLGAIALGATIIEKHFTLDKTMDGPDHRASLEPNELKSLVDGIRIIEKSLGDGEKKPTISEEKNKLVARKSIVAKTNIKKGDILSKDNLTVKRPANGISPMKWYELIGTKATKNFEEDELITL